MNKKILVTTGIKKKRKNSIYLGKWCFKIKNRKLDFSNFNILPYHWDNRSKLLKDSYYLDELYEYILKILSKKLNRIHDVNYPISYWRILIGMWLGHFIQIVFDRWSMIDIAVKNEKNLVYENLHQKKENFIPNDCLVFVHMYQSDAWNEHLYNIIINNSFKKKFIFLKKKKKNILILKKKIKILSSVYSFFLKKYNNFFFFKNNFFFHSTYLPKLDEINLQFHLRQFPTIWRSDTIPTFEINEKYRSWNLNENLVYKNRFEKFLIKILPTYMPRSYLEGFKILEKKSDKSFPRYPGAIFTSNSYAYDDFFKIWAAKKSIKKVPIIIGQHGGHMGTCLFGFYLTHQFKISNFFLTWGWKEVKKNYPLVNFLLDKKNLIKSKNDLKNKKKIILVLTGWPKFSYHISAQPISVQYIDYLKDIFKFNSYLNEKVKQNLIVKEYFQNFEWIDKNLIKKEFKNIEIYDGKKKLKEFYKISKLIISTSNSTTFLESMALNIPTILFFNPVHSELNKSAKKQFLELKRVGIYHDTAESAANHLVKIENNICEWWFSHKLQVARLNFCKKYSIFSDKKVSILKNFFYKLKQK